jgi:hypothetical protein
MSTQIKTIKTIPLMDLMSHFDSRYRIDSHDYWSVLIDDHMFRGNDTTKKYYNVIVNEIPDESVLNALQWPDAIRAIIQDPQGHPGEEEVCNAINQTSVADWAVLFKEAVKLKKREEGKENATLDDYWYDYLVRATFESMVTSEYQLKNEENLYYYISW